MRTMLAFAALIVLGYGWMVFCDAVKAELRAGHYVPRGRR